MASSPSKPAPVKLLKEHLQEQQEPFKLSTYLAERRYSMKKLSTDGDDSSSLSNYTNNFKETCSSSLRKKRILHAPRNLKSFLYKLIAPAYKQELSTCKKALDEKLVSETIDMIQQIAETNWFSTVSSVTPFSASAESDNGALEQCNDSLVAETSLALHATFYDKTDTDICQRQWGCMENHKQLSQASALQDVTSDKAGPASPILIQGLVSAFLLKWLAKSATENKRVMPQGKNLLLNCIKKAIVHNVRDNERQNHVHELLSIEEAERIISRQLCSLGKQLLNATNAVHMINLDFSSTQEWNCFQQTKWQICRDMGDSIMDEIINEIINFCSSRI